jgi:hypothetical protein
MKEAKRHTEFLWGNLLRSIHLKDSCSWEDNIKMNLRTKYCEHGRKSN